MTRELTIDGASIRSAGDFGNALVAAINPEDLQDGWIEDNLDAINDDLRQVYELGYGKVVISNSAAMRKNLGSLDASLFDKLVDMFSDKALQLELR
jgi:DNA replication initiation complex subunit (GINS family)